MIEVIGRNVDKNKELIDTLKILKEKETNIENLKKIIKYL